MTAADIAAHEGAWVEPLRADVRGTEILELPPPTQGIAALEALRIVDGLDLGADGPDREHLLIEAMKLALADRDAYLGDPAAMTVDCDELLADEWIADRRARIDPARAQRFAPRLTPNGGTIYLNAADRDGLLVSLIQSNFFGAGCGLRVDEWGINLHNRGSAFNFDAGHPNAFGPSKMPLHTLIPGLALRDGRPWLVFGSEGGHGQAQTHLQLLTRMLVDGDDPQAAITAPRFTIDPETGRVAIEDHFDPAWIDDLRRPRSRDRRRPGAPARSRDRARDRVHGERVPRRFRSPGRRRRRRALTGRRIRVWPPVRLAACRDRGAGSSPFPNVISVVRLACVPLFLWLLWGADNELAAGLLAAGLGATDWVDGYIARHFDQGSELGKILDPTADRVLLVAVAIAVLTQGLPVAVNVVVWIMLIREVLIAAATVALGAGRRAPDRRRVGRQGGHARADVLAADVPRRRRDHRVVARVLHRVRVGIRDRRHRPRVLRRVALRPRRPRGATRRSGITSRSGGSSMKAVILAGGEGTRLRPLTSNQPKPMMPIANVPMMEHIVKLLARHGFDDIVVTVAFMANHIRTYFGDGSELGVRMRYATEEAPLGTAGSVRNAMAELDETFLVISGDVLTDVDLGGIVEQHNAREAFATIALKRVENPVDFGIVITREDGQIERFLEKPTWGEVFSDTINTGIYVLDPGVFDFIPEGEVVDFSGDVFPAVLDRGLPLLGTVVDGYWEDVGTLESYRTAHENLLDGQVAASSCPGFQLREGVWIGEGVDVSPDAIIHGPGARR